MKRGHFFKQNFLYAGKYFGFQPDGLFLGAENLFLDFFQLGRDKTLAVYNGLLPLIPERHFIEHGFADFYIVTENFVIADFKVFYSRGFALAGFEIQKPFLPVVACVSEPVEFAVETAFYVAAVFGNAGGSFVDSLGQKIFDVGMKIDAFCRLRYEFAFK